MVNVYFCVINEVTKPILNELRHVRSKNVKLWFDDDAISSDPYIRSIKDKGYINHKNIDNELSCFSWDIVEKKVTGCYDGKKHLVSRCVLDNSSCVCVDDVAHTNDQLVFFQDARHKKDYPKGFIKVPCFNVGNNLFDFLSSKGVFTFALDDETRFEKCKGIDPVQGASVYKELKTGHYWYKDMFHKNHYEVFGKGGREHLGEADLEGILDKTKADKKKHINVA